MRLMFVNHDDLRAFFFILNIKKALKMRVHEMKGQNPHHWEKGRVVADNRRLHHFLTLLLEERDRDKVLKENDDMRIKIRELTREVELLSTSVSDKQKELYNYKLKMDDLATLKTQVGEMREQLQIRESDKEMLKRQPPRGSLAEHARFVSYQHATKYGPEPRRKSVTVANIGGPGDPVSVGHFAQQTKSSRPKRKRSKADVVEEEVRNRILVDKNSSAEMSNVYYDTNLPQSVLERADHH